jgi:hypothetical protein
MEALFIIAAVLLCIGLPLGLLVALISWLARRGQSQAPAPTTPPSRTQILAEFKALVERWQLAGQLSPEVADQLRALLAREVAAVPTSAPVVPAALTPTPAAVVPAPAPTVALTSDAASLHAAAAPTPTATPVAPPPAPAAPAGPSLGERLGGALLALRTRQTVLFLGAFLLLVSALILIVFNWASFPPILQFALLAGVCGGFWAGGGWLIRQTDLDRAGRGLQAVGGLLVPVVAFSLSRPGLLELAPRDGWLLASVLCVPIYGLAAWRLRRIFYMIAGCVSAASAVLAAVSGQSTDWLPAALLITLAAYLPLSSWLRPRAPDLADGPRWVAHVGVPLALLSAVLLDLDRSHASYALATALWSGAGFYLLARLTDGRAAWGWVAALLPSAALLATLSALEAGAPWWGVAPALLALGGLALALALEPRAGAAVLPAYAGAAALALLSAVPILDSGATARWALPPLLAGALGLTLAYHRGRLAWLGAPARLGIATAGLASASVLLAAWAAAMLGLSTLEEDAIGLALLPLAALYLVGAASWPGRLRAPYDLALQAVGVLLALIGGVIALGAGGEPAHLLTGLAALWLFQALRHRNPIWAAATLGTALACAGAWLDLAWPYTPAAPIAELALAFAALYLVGGSLLRSGGWRYWAWPAIGWGALSATIALAVVLIDLDTGDVLAWHVLIVVGLAAAVALAGALWRAAWPGFAVAGLLVLATLLAGGRGFFTGWLPAEADMGYIICGITAALVLAGQALRRIGARYAYPYELVGYALLTLAPIPAAGDAQHATLVWTAMLALYALAAWLYRLRWAAAPALLALDMALLSGSAWLLPGGRPAGAGLILLGAAYLQGLLGWLWWRRRVTPVALKNLSDAFEPAYVVACISGAGALAIGAREDGVLAIVAFGLAALLAALSTAHRTQLGAWAALGLAGLGFAALHRTQGLSDDWSMAAGVAEALGFCLLGWLIEWRMKNEELSKIANPGALAILNSSFAIWSLPLTYGPLAAGVVLTADLGALLTFGRALMPLTFALAMLALLLATLAARLRESLYAYAAAAALVAAGLCQIYDWGFRQPQWFVIPAGLYLLALGAALRRFQRQRQVAQLVETGAIVLMLGVSFGQSLRSEGIESQGYAAWLCVESLLLLGYGVLAKLRAPFLGGAAFFVAGVLWLSLDPLMAMNKWVLLGLLGLLLVGFYVLLERRQQELVRAGRALIDTVSSWG